MGQCVHQASCFHTELVPADPVWSPPNAILDNRKGNILEPFPLSYCVWKRLLLIFSFLFHGGLVSYLNGTHGTCVCVCVSMGFSRQKYWSRLPCLPPGNVPDPGIEPMSPEVPALQADSLLQSPQGSQNMV